MAVLVVVEPAENKNVVYTKDFGQTDSPCLYEGVFDCVILPRFHGITLWLLPIHANKTEKK